MITSALLTKLSSVGPRYCMDLFSMRVAAIANIEITCNPTNSVRFMFTLPPGYTEIYTNLIRGLN